jgi:HPt (histidine-containing phosphotransfer) domain-containing protein
MPVVSYSRITNSSNQDESAFKEDEDFLKKIRINFTKSSSNIYSEIENAYNSGDLKLAHRIAHTLKSNAGQIGEKKLQETAAEIEEMLAKGSNPFQSGSMKTLNDELKQVLDKFTPLLAEIENARAAKITLEGYPDMQKIREILLKLETMLLNKNPECEDLIDDVMTIPETEELLKQIDSFNFKQASFELTKLKEKLGVF